MHPIKIVVESQIPEFTCTFEDLPVGWAFRWPCKEAQSGILVKACGSKYFRICDYEALRVYDASLHSCLRDPVIPLGPVTKIHIQKMPLPEKEDRP